MKKNILLNLIYIIIPLFFIPTSINAKDIKLKLHHFLGKTSTTHKEFILPWANKIEKDSNYKIKIDIFPSMQLGGKPPRLIDQVQDGVVDIVWTLPGYTPGRFPISSVFELPFMVSTAEATSQAIQEFSTKFLKKEFQNVKPLLFHVHARGVFHTIKPIKKINDVNGMTIRAPTRAIANALKEIGATPIFMPVPQVPEALARGVVDGAMIPWEVGYPLKVHELIDSHTEIIGPKGLYTAVFLLAMNKKSYEKIPNDLKKIIDKNSGINIAKDVGKIWDEAEKIGINAAKLRGNSVYRMDKKETEKLKKITRKVIYSWISNMDKNGEDGKLLYDEANKLVEKYTLNQKK